MIVKCPFCGELNKMEDDEGWFAGIDLEAMDGWTERRFQCRGCGARLTLTAFVDVTAAYLSGVGLPEVRIGPDDVDEWETEHERSRDMNRKPVRKPSQNATKSKKAGKPSSASTAKGKAVERPAKGKGKGARR